MGEMRDVVKTALRITHDKLNDEIDRLIETAKAELIRTGADKETVGASGKLVTQAVITYCLMNLTENSNLIEKYQNAFELQADQIRRSRNVQ